MPRGYMKRDRPDAQTRKCLLCGKPYDPIRVHQKWCSHECKFAAHRQRTLMRVLGGIIGGLVDGFKQANLLGVSTTRRGRGGKPGGGAGIVGVEMEEVLRGALGEVVKMEGERRLRLEAPPKTPTPERQVARDAIPGVG